MRGILLVLSEEPTTLDEVRLARQGYEAMSRGDLDAVMSLFAADAVYDMSDAGLGTFEGAEAIRRFIEDWHRSYAEYRYEEEELLDLGHGVLLSVVRESGRLVGGSGRVEERVAHLHTWANGKIEWFKHYPDPDEARGAAERLAEKRRVDWVGLPPGAQNSLVRACSSSSGRHAPARGLISAVGRLAG